MEQPRVWSPHILVMTSISTRPALSRQISRILWKDWRRHWGSSRKWATLLPHCVTTNLSEIVPHRNTPLIKSIHIRTYWKPKRKRRNWRINSPNHSASLKSFWKALTPIEAAYTLKICNKWFSIKETLSMIWTRETKDLNHNWDKKKNMFDKCMKE